MSTSPNSRRTRWRPSTSVTVPSQSTTSGSRHRDLIPAAAAEPRPRPARCRNVDLGRSAECPAASCSSWRSPSSRRSAVTASRTGRDSRDAEGDDGADASDRAVVRQVEVVGSDRRRRLRVGVGIALSRAQARRQPRPSTSTASCRGPWRRRSARSTSSASATGSSSIPGESEACRRQGGDAAGSRLANAVGANESLHPHVQRRAGRLGLDVDPDARAATSSTATTPAETA